MSTNRPNKKNSPKQTPAPLSKLIEEMNAIIKSNPKDAAAYFNRGMIYHEQGDDKQANADYKKAVQLEPKLKAEVESYIASQQKRGENFKKIPTAVLADQLSSFLTASDMRN